MHFNDSTIEFCWYRVNSNQSRYWFGRKFTVHPPMRPTSPPRGMMVLHFFWYFMFFRCVYYYSINNDSFTARMSEKKKYDLWRDSSLRYMGYANEVGEAFRPQFPRLVGPSYGVAFAYVGCDTLDKSISSYKSGKCDNSEVLRVSMDTFLWQLLASVLIPGKIIHWVTHASQSIVSSTFKKSGPLKKWLPTMIGLGCIPLIIHPIDTAVDNAMDLTFRKWWTKK